MAGKSPGQFALAMSIMAKSLGEASNAVGAEACFAAGEYLVRNTPIDTGQAKSNWQASRVRPRTKTRPAYYPGGLAAGQAKASTEGPNMAAAIAQIRTECESRRKNQRMYLTNNLDYIEKLDAEGGNRGTSQFMRAATQRAAEVLKDSQLFRKALSGKAGVFKMESF